jgi:hypothetical protein
VSDFAVEADSEPEAEPVGTEPEEEITIVADFGAELRAEPEESATDSFFGGGAPPNRHRSRMLRLRRLPLRRPRRSAGSPSAGGIPRTKRSALREFSCPT